MPMILVEKVKLICNYDPQNCGSISVRDLRDFLATLSTHGKLTTPEVSLICRYFDGNRRIVGKRVSAKPDEEEHKSVSIREIMAALGKEYVGNLQQRIQLFLRKQFLEKSAGATELETSDSLDCKYILRLLNQGQVATVPFYYTYEQIEGLFKSLGLCTILSHEQIGKIISKLDSKRNRQISISQVLSYLGVTYKASELPSHNVKSESIKVDAESLLRLLLEKVQSMGVAVDQAFRHFDTNGDGQISSDELQQGLSELGIFSHIPRWEDQIPTIVKRFDSSGDGTVSIREFFKFLGISEYTPNIVQRLTKTFAIALQKQLSFKDIFTELDENKNGVLDAEEIVLGCKKLGTFQEVTLDDAHAIINEFDTEKRGRVSLKDFIAYFSSRIDQYHQSQRKKNVGRIIKRFREVITTARDKGGVQIRDIFNHLDKDKGGSLSLQELAQGLKSMPNFKSLSDQDISDLISAIDTDKSGEITADEFESFVLEKERNETQPKRVQSVSEDIERIKEVFLAAQKNGLSSNKLFELMDRNKSKYLSFDEFDALLRQIPSLKTVSNSDFRKIFGAIDKDGSGEISIEEFRNFLETNCEMVKFQSKPVISSAGRPTVERENEIPQERSRRSLEDVRELFIRHMRRISEIDGSIQALIAYLDDDEDGLISTGKFYSLLRREGVFQTLDEGELQSLLMPCFYSKSKHAAKGPTGEEHVVDDKIEVGSLLKLLEGRNISSMIRKDYLEIDEDENGSTFQTKEYQFSNDLELKLVEKKLRAFGRNLAKKGVNVEREFQQYDPKLLGYVSRTDFIKVLSKLGIYLLEEGKVLVEGISKNDDTMVKKFQQQQIQRIKSSSFQEYSYVNTIPKLARRAYQFDQRNNIEFKNHLESLTMIDWYRQGQKQMLLQQVLSHSLAHNIELFPRFGKTLFFEYPIQNPFNHEETFEIEIQQSELRVITSFEEWVFCRKHLRPCYGDLGVEPAEAEMFDNQTNGNVRVTLLPNETLHIPFSFLSLVPLIGVNSFPSRKLENKGEAKGELQELDQSVKRVICAKILSTTHGNIISILNVKVKPRPFVVNRVLRFQEFENTVAKRRVQLVGILKDVPLIRSSVDMKFVHCVEHYSDVGARSATEMSRVVVEWGSDHYNGDELTHVLNLLIRYRCMEANGMGMFYLLIYNDPYQSVLFETWQVVVHTRLRLDSQCVIGTICSADLVVRGDQHARRVQAFSNNYSNNQSITFRPDSVFHLVSSAYNRIILNIHPRKLGNHRALINLIDVDSKELLSCWLVSIHAQAPAVMRTYDVEVPIGQVLYKKILFKNLWESHRKYIVSSSDENLMRSRNATVDVGPQGAAYLRLWFNSWPEGLAGVREVYLFLNDYDSGNNEECNLFRLHAAH